MQEIPGKRPNTSRFVYDGYEYHVDTTSVNIYRCTTRSTTGCGGTARVDDNHRVDVYVPHDGHERNDTIVEESRIRIEMLDLATRTNAPLKEIFDDVCRRNPILAPKFIFPTMRNAMQRARAKVRPNIPGSLRELAEVLDTYEPTQRVYRGMVEADDGSLALIFASEQMLEALRESREIYVDGTFKVAPYHPPIVQLYTIHMRIMDTGIAAVYVLCGARTKALYHAIFTKIIELAPGLVQNLRSIMGDYERATMSAMRGIFPESSLHGCWFHFNQALSRRWKRLGLSDVQTPILAMAMALPLAPAVRFDDGLTILSRKADEIAVEHPAILQFMLYLRRQWSPLAEVVSVHGCAIRTNNLVESFHNEAKRKLGGLHPNIWKFIEHLTDLMTNQGMDMIRLRNGERARRARTLRNMTADALIWDAQHDLNVGRYTLTDFLVRCANRTAGHATIRQNVREQDEEPELVEAGVMAAGEPRDGDLVVRARRRRRGDGARQRSPVNRNRDEEDAAPEALNRVQVLEHPAEIPPAQVEPEVRLDGRPADRDIYHLPEDDWEHFPQPEEDVPFHPVDPLPVVRQNDHMPLQEPEFCCACMVALATHACIPCGHRCCCADCSELIEARCPICRTIFIGIYLIRRA